MDILSQALLWIGTHFTAGVYLNSTKVQGLMWSTADIVLVFIFLRIADVLRVREGVRRIRWRYVILAGTALLTPLLVFAATPRQILILESIVCGTQFLLLVVTLFTEKRRFLDLSRDLGKKVRGEVFHTEPRRPSLFP